MNPILEAEAAVSQIIRDKVAQIRPFGLQAWWAEVLPWQVLSVGRTRFSCADGEVTYRVRP